MTFITIAIPTYNNQATISKAIDSCLSQTDLEDVEILVINNASTDGTSDILLGYGNSIVVVLNDETVSLFENHNVALKNAKGEYVVFCHSDDSLLPDAIEILKSNIKKRGCPKRYVLWGHSLFRDFYSAIRNSNFSPGQMFAGIHATNPFLEGGLTPSGTCYSKCFIEIGGFLPTQHKLAPSDAISMINAALHGYKFEMIQDIIFRRTTASTLLRSTSKSDSLHGYENAFQNLLEVIEGSSLSDIVDSTHAMHFMPINFMRFCAGKYPKAVLIRLLKSLIKRPLNIFTPGYSSAIIFALARTVNAKGK